MYMLPGDAEENSDDICQLESDFKGDPILE
jgi:hypothetical protein